MTNEEALALFIDKLKELTKKEENEILTIFKRIESACRNYYGRT